jgi:hypothetical protein
MPTKKEVSNLLYEELKGPLAGMGYSGKKSDFTFRSTFDGWDYFISGDVAMYHIPVAEFHFLATCHALGKIVAEGLPERARNVGFQPTFIFQHSFFYSKPNEREDYYIEADDYYGIVADSFLDLLKDKIHPALEDFRDLKKLDELVNQIPFKYFIFFGCESEQTLKGLVLRYLTNPTKYDEVEAMYQGMQKSFDKYQQKEFKKLSEFLRSKL